MSDLVEIIYNELYNYNNSDSEQFFKKVLGYSKSGYFHKITVKDDHCVSIHNDYEARNYGCNFYIVIFPQEGIVLMLTLAQILAISGLQLWIDYESCIQFPMFRLDIYESHKDSFIQFKSPNIIVCSLCVNSLIYNHRYIDKNSDNSYNEINVNIGSILNRY